MVMLVYRRVHIPTMHAMIPFQSVFLEPRISTTDSHGFLAQPQDSWVVRHQVLRDIYHKPYRIHTGWWSGT